LLSHGYMDVLVPRLVLEEFQKNRKRVAERRSEASARTSTRSRTHPQGKRAAVAP